MLTIGKRFDLKKSGVTSLEKEFLTCLNFFLAASEIYFFDGELTKIRLLPGLTRISSKQRQTTRSEAVSLLNPDNVQQAAARGRYILASR